MLPIIIIINRTKKRMNLVITEGNPHTKQIYTPRRSI